MENQNGIEEKNGAPAARFVRMVDGPPLPKAVVLTMPQSKEIEDESRGLAVVQVNLTITTHADYMAAGEKLKSIVRAKNQVVNLFLKAKKTAHNAHAEICAAEKKLLDPLKKAEDEYGKKVKGYLMAKAAREAQEALQRRKEAEEEAQRKAVETQKAQDDERIKVAEQLQASGFKEEAEAVLSQEVPPVPVAPIIIAPVEKGEVVSGQHLRKTYKFVVDNMTLLVQEVAAGRQPIAFLLPNQKALDQMATALKNELRIPGGHVVENSSLVNRDTSSRDDIQQ